MSTSPTLSRAALLAVSLVLASSGSGFAHAQGLLDKSVVLNVGGFAPGIGLQANLNGQLGENPPVDFNKAFGDKRNGFHARIDGLWRISQNHHVNFSYFEAGRTRTRAVDKELKWRDYTFAAGAEVQSQVKSAELQLGYEYTLLRRPSYEIVGTAGVHVTQLTTRLSGNARVAGSVNQSASFQTSDTSLTAPLPLIGVRGRWMLTPQFYVDAHAQALKASVDSVEGRWNDLRLAGTWMINDRFGVGAAYTRFDTRLEVKKSNFDGNVKFGYDGLLVYLTTAF